MSQPSVLFVCRELHVGGAERQWALLLPELARHGITSRLVATAGGGQSLEEIRGSGIPVVELNAAHRQRARRVPFVSLRNFPRLLEEARPSVIVSWGYTAHLVSSLYAQLKRVPHLLSYHRAPGYTDTRARESAIALAGRLGAGAIAVTRSQLPDLRRFHVHESRVRIAPNGLPRPRHNVSPLHRAAVRRELGLDGATFTAVLVARLRREKRVDDFLRAVTCVARRGIAIRGVVVGDGPTEVSLRREAAQLRAPVDFVGLQPDPIPYMLASDVVCLTSELEALPMTLIEAAACGIPAIATDVGGTREVVIDGVNGVIVEMGDVRGFARALEALASDRERLARMGASGVRIWEARYSLDSMVVRYAELLGGVSGPPTQWLVD